MRATRVPPLPTGGDAIITKCFWYQGYGVTDPGFRFEKVGSMPVVFNGLQNDHPRVRGTWLCLPACPPAYLTARLLRIIHCVVVRLAYTTAQWPQPT